MHKPKTNETRMKIIKEATNMNLISLIGTNGESSIMNLEKKKAKIISGYEIYYQDKEMSEPIIANNKTPEKFYIVKSNRKAEKIYIKYNETIQRVADASTVENEKEFEGRMLLTWQEEKSDSEINLLWIDGKKKDYKTLTFSCYGYPIKKIMNLFVQMLSSVHDDYKRFLLPDNSKMDEQLA